MNINKNLAIAGIAGIGAGIGATITALIMTKDCQRMIEKNIEENKELNQKLEEMKTDMVQAKQQYEECKAQIETASTEASKMKTAIVNEFNTIATNTNAYQENLRKVSKVSIQIMKEELGKMVNQAQKDIDGIKQEILDKIKQDDIEDNNDNDSDDVTEKMINQIDQDTGKATFKNSNVKNRRRKKKNV